MPLYLNELAPWERKSEHYTMVEMGKDVRQQKEILRRSTAAMLRAQQATANAVVVSQERVAAGLDDLAGGIGRIEDGIQGLQASFEWGISEVVWQIELSRKVLKDILDVLMKPLDTEAKELRRRAEEAYANAWFDDALQDFLESEKKNRYDFSVHISIGMIYLFQKVDKVKALEYFEKAIKYARPKSPYYASLALLHKGLIKFDGGDAEEAESCTAKAIQLTPDFAEAHYQNAQYNAQLNRPERSIASLEKAILRDRRYCLRAQNDPFFDPVREEVNRLFGRLREAEKSVAQAKYTRLSQTHKELRNILLGLLADRLPGGEDLLGPSQDLTGQLAEIGAVINRNSYFDFLDANEELLPRSGRRLTELIERAWRLVEDIIHSSKGAMEASRTKKEEKRGGSTGLFLKALLVGSFVVPAVATLFAANGWEKLHAIFFLIPILSQFISVHFLYVMATDYSSLDTESKAFTWSLLAYIIVVLFFYSGALATTQTEMNHTLAREEETLQRARKYQVMLSKFARG